MKRALLVMAILLACVAAARAQSPVDIAPLIQREEVLEDTGNLVEAVPLARRIIEEQARQLGPRHVEVAESWLRLAMLQLRLGEIAAAREAARKSLDIADEAWGAGHVETLPALTALAAASAKAGAWSDAEPLFLRALEIGRREPGAEQARLAEGLDNLGRLYLESGQYEKARALLEEELRLPIRDPALLAGPRRDLARACRQLGRYEKAEALLREALLAEGTDAIEARTDLAFLLLDLGRYAEAERLLLQARQAAARVHGEASDAAAQALSNLAVLYVDLSNVPRAIQLYERALAIGEKLHGPDSPALLPTIERLAEARLRAADAASAERLYLRALKLAPDDAYVLGQLGRTYEIAGRPDDARTTLARALAEVERAQGPTHPDTAEALRDLADLCFGQGRYDEAAPLYARAAGILEASAGTTHASTVAAWLRLAALYLANGQADAARPLLARATQALQGARADVATAENLHTLSYLSSDLGGDTKPALALHQRAMVIEDATLANVLGFSSERQRLAFQTSLDPWSLPASLDDAQETAEAVLRHKGIVLDSLLEDLGQAERGADPDARDLARRLREARSALSALLFSGGAEDEREALTRTVEDLEARLVSLDPRAGRTRRALRVTVPQVQAALPAGTVLVEYVRYHRYLGRNRWEPSYGAVVLAADAPPRWVTLGPAASLEELVRLYRLSVRGETDEATLQATLRQLYDRAWAPLPLPTSARDVVVSPDGELGLVSFATLLDHQQRFLAQTRAVRYVASGRDLLDTTAPSASKTLVVYADVDFGRPNAAAGGARGEPAAASRTLLGLQFKRLPGTAREALLLSREAPSWGWRVRLARGAEASKTRLQQVRSPYVLHLATHGFFLPDPPARDVRAAGPTARGGATQNPMQRSGLAFSGAQSTLDALRRGRPLTAADNGILTVADVEALDLAGTWLVTLSACDTGSGEARAGEGVLGLRRGFVLSGARNLLMTLWPVDDAATADFMIAFYRKARGGDAPRALAEVQRDCLVQWRRARGLLRAVSEAGPFIVTFQGKP